MCLVIYVAAPTQLPLIPWDQNAPAFNVTELMPSEEPVRRHLAQPHVRQAGSHTGCGCGFNEGRQYGTSDDVDERTAAIESASELARYVTEHRVEHLYSCWNGDEGEPQESVRKIKAHQLFAPDFYFRERELLVIIHDGDPLK
jgi:hypothetical protein